CRLSLPHLIFTLTPLDILCRRPLPNRTHHLHLTVIDSPLHIAAANSPLDLMTVASAPHDLSFG
ncbi:hypothetical protein TorRG33x02_295740, partial [Trema orientale]